MHLDTQTQFSGSIGASGASFGQPVTASALSANVLDLRNASTPTTVDEGLLGEDLWLIVQILTAAAGGDAAKTLTITLESDITADLATAPLVHYSSGAIAGATLVAGYVAMRAKLPSADYQRYLGLRYTVSAPFTSFTLAAFLTPNPQANIIYPAGFSIS